MDRPDPPTLHDVVKVTFTRDGQTHHHAGRLIRDVGITPGRSGVRGWEVRLFRPMRNTEPNTAEQSIVLTEEEITVLRARSLPVQTIRRVPPKRIYFDPRTQALCADHA